MIYGRIIKGVGGFYYVQTQNGVYECRARGIFRKDNITPLVGDYVQIQILDETEKKGSLELINERKSELIRPRVANIDQAVIVFSSVKPNINLDLLDKFIILASEQELNIVICINKIDIDKKEKYKQAVLLYESAGYKIIAMSAVKGSGTQELAAELRGKISVFAGPSGAGKSSIINFLIPDANMQTGEISSKIGRGKHTTRHAELLRFDEDSFIVDSPGFTSLSLSHVPEGELKYYFLEFHEVNNKCRFNGCNHINEPDCAVKESIGGEISEIRYNRYVTIFEEIQSERKNRYD